MFTVRKEKVKSMNNCININFRFIISLTLCPHGVRDSLTGEIITKQPSTILETTTKTYVVEEILHHIDEGQPVQIALSKIRNKNKAKKSDYRPHHREQSEILINKDFIISSTFTEAGIIDNTNNKSASDGLSTVIETVTKTYVATGNHYDTANKFLTVPLTDIKASAPTKNADFISK